MIKFDRTRPEHAAIMFLARQLAKHPPVWSWAERGDNR